MPTLSLSLDAGAQSASLSKTVTAAHLTRFVAALKQKYKDENGVEPSDVDAVNLWMADIMQSARILTRQYEERDAIRTASAGVTEIDLT